MLTICDYSMAIRREALVLGVNAKGTLCNTRVWKGPPLKYLYSIGLLCRSAEIVVNKFKQLGNFVRIVIVLSMILQLQFKME